MRGLSHELIDSRLDQRIEWRLLARKRWQHTTEDVGWNVITTQIRDNLHTVCQTILDADSNVKIIVSTHFGWVYTNNINLINQLRQFRCLTNKTYTQAIINRPKNTILLKRSQYQHRTYFYSVKLTTTEKETITNFFTNQREHIRLSPALELWLYESPFYRLQDYFFIDYTNEQWLTMLALIRPGLIRKTLKIITK